MKIARFALTLLLAGAAVAQQYTISTLAGGIPIQTPIPAVNASIGIPFGLAMDAAGNLYFASDYCIFKMDRNGVLNRFAGNSRLGFSGDGGQATDAQFRTPSDVAVDSLGNLYVADTYNHAIRKISLNGVISTVLGGGDFGPLIGTRLSQPWAVAVDGANSLYVADSGNSRILKISQDGTITTVAGGGGAGFSGDSGAATAAQLDFPVGLVFDTSGTLYISDAGNARIRKIAPNGIITTIGGNGTIGYSGDGGQAVAAQINHPWGITVDAAGNVYFADTYNARVRRITPTGIITTAAGSGLAGGQGDGAQATAAQLNQPAGVAIDSAGNLFISEAAFRIRMVSAIGTISTVAGNGFQSYSGDGGIAVNAQLLFPFGTVADSIGNLYIADYGNNRVRKIARNGVITTVAGNGTAGFSGDGGQATSAQLNQPVGLAVDTAGNLYICDSGNQRIRKVSGNGTITTFAGTGTVGFSGDGGQATNAQLSNPWGLAVDGLGGLYIADFGNNRIRKVLSNGVISTFAGGGSNGLGDGALAINAQLSGPLALVLDSSGTAYISDYGNGRIRKVTPSGVITTFAGGGSDGLFSPAGIAIDSSGGVIFADVDVVRQVSTTGLTTIIAGTGVSGYSGDGGPATKAMLGSANAMGLTIDGSGTIYLADAGNNAVRALQPVGGTLSIVTTSPLVPATISVSYVQSLSATGGTPPYSWSLISGTLPAGLALSPSGVISGIPATAGGTTFIVQVNDAASVMKTQTFSLTVNSANTPLAITTPATLPSAFIGGAYSITFAATSGTSPYTWSVSSGSLPSGLTLSSAGAITGTPTTAGTSSFMLKVTDSASATATQTFSLTVITAGVLARSGVLAHLAGAGGWTTVVSLINTSVSPVPITLTLHGDDGSALNLPLTTTQQGSTQTTTSSLLNVVINPNSTLLISMGGQTGSTVVGWADVLSSGPVSGFAIFRQTASNGTASEGTVPLLNQYPSKIVVPYDNTTGFITGVAIANLSASSANVTMTMYDQNGTQLGTQPLALAGTGHTSFAFPDKLPLTAGKQGIVVFQSTGTSLTGLGLRFSPFGTFTSVPTILQ